MPVLWQLKTSRAPETPMPAVNTQEMATGMGGEGEVAAGIVKGDGSCSSSTSSTSSSEDTSELEEEIAAQLMPDQVQNEVPGPLFQHPNSRVLHRPRRSDELLLCGRRNSGYRWLPDGASMQWARCHFCFKGEVLTSQGQMASKLDTLRAERAPAASGSGPA